MSVSVAAGGEILFAHRGNVPRRPASNEKLLLSMALLDRFGPRYRIPTTAEGVPPAGGTIGGKLWLVGRGDPELDGASLERLALAIRAAGVRRVRGSVVGVTSTFTRERWAPGWTPIALHFIGLPTALTFDGNAGQDGYVFDPEREAAASLTSDLRAEGIRVDGSPGAGPEPPTQAVLATVRSAPLVEILRHQNEDSLNLDAEDLAKMLGAAAFGPPGSIAKGARAIQAWARRRGEAVVARDGSGLSYGDRVTTDTLVRLLAWAGSTSWGRALRSTLAAPGQGTLVGRLAGVRVRAKTGTLIERVSALSGWVWLAQSGRWAEFSILSKGLTKPEAVSVEDAVVRTIAREAS